MSSAAGQNIFWHDHFSKTRSKNLQKLNYNASRGETVQLSEHTGLIVHFLLWILKAQHNPEYAYSKVVQLTVATGTASSNYKWFRHWYWYTAVFHVWNFQLLWPPILIPLYWHIMASSNEWAWHHMAVQSASPILLLLHASPSAQSNAVIVWGWLL